MHTDPIEKSMVMGTLGQTATGGDLGWRAISSDAEGRFRGNGYISTTYEAPAETVMILQAEGNSIAYVNGVIRPGDVYGYGYLRLPVRLQKGTNHFLFTSGRGGVKAKLSQPKKPVYLEPADPTLPDFVIGDRNPAHAGIVVTNTTSRRIEGMTLTATVDGAIRKTWLPSIPPMSVRKVGFQLPPPTRTDQDEVDAELRLAQGEAVVDDITIKLRLRAPSQSHKRTFVSEIDGSVQYYGVQPANPLPNDYERPGIVLTLHGASVEAIGQADAYAPKNWAHLVAPTNRRPYGFDWEDWGRMDAIEVLEDAARRLRTDPSRVYLTGHSMGGHGAWQVGAHFPGRFGAVGPSAGWATFWSYVGSGRRPMDQSDPMQEVLWRAMNPSDSVLLLPNLAAIPVYILHGDSDETVPVREARTMAQELGKFHTRWTLFEQKGAGHWWDDIAEPGAACVDWPPMFDLFAATRVASDKETRHVSFVTVNPENSAAMKWATILSQSRQMAPSRIDLRMDPHARLFTGTTENVHRLALSVAHLEAGKPLNIDIDGTKIADIRWPLGSSLLLERDAESWRVVEAIPPHDKSPARSSGFKNAFDNRMVFVYGTRGNAEENAWAAARARFDAEAFYYRGNGAVDVMPDTEFGASIDVHRSVVVYGNADTNSVWKSLLADSPVNATRTSVKLGGSTLAGGDSALLLCRPRPGSAVASVAAVGGTGIVGMRLSDRLNYFFAGVAFPDFFVVGPEMLDSGYAGVRAAGFFDTDWSLGGDMVLRQ